MVIYLRIKKSEFQLLNISQCVVKKILSCFDTNTIAVMDQIPAKFLKEGANVLAHPLAEIINLYFQKNLKLLS